MQKRSVNATICISGFSRPSERFGIQPSNRAVCKRKSASSKKSFIGNEATHSLWKRSCEAWRLPFARSNREPKVLRRIVRELRSRVRSLENDVAHQQAALQHLRESAERDSVRADCAAGELASLTVRYEILQANLAEMDNRLAAQTEELLVSTSAESARLATLIDTAQSSHFWKLKNWLVRLRVRALGSALPPERVRVKSRP